MKTLLRLGFAYGLLFGVLLFSWLFVGCASSSRVNWDSRIGNFTYDQAVAEKGPPDKSTRLNDGSTVAEWFIKHGSSFSFGVGTGFYSGGSAVGVGQTVGTVPSGEYLRLTFGSDGRLTRWERARH